MDENEELERLDTIKGTEVFFYQGNIITSGKQRNVERVELSSYRFKGIEIPSLCIDTGQHIWIVKKANQDRLRLVQNDSIVGYSLYDWARLESLECLMDKEKPAHFIHALQILNQRPNTDIDDRTDDIFIEDAMTGFEKRFIVPIKKHVRTRWIYSPETGHFAEAQVRGRYKLLIQIEEDKKNQKNK